MYTAKDYPDIPSKRDRRRLATQHRLMRALESAPDEIAKAKINAQLSVVSDRLRGVKKASKKKAVTKEEDTKYVIDILHMSFSSVKRSERRKNKGKSRKGLRKVKTVTLVKTIKAIPGMIQRLRDGNGGVSPRTHTFRIRLKEEID